MRKNNRLVIVFVSVTILFSFLILFKCVFSSFIPIVYLFIFYPYFIHKWLKLAFDSSSYVKKNHINFYNKYKSFTNSLDGKMVPILTINYAEIEKLNDNRVIEFIKEIQKIRAMMLACFLCFIFLCVLLIGLS